jgi:hypothetical protein
MKYRLRLIGILISLNVLGCNAYLAIPTDNHPVVEQNNLRERAVVKNSNCDYMGVITGVDHTRCGCCGGYKIEINGQTFLTDHIPNFKEILGPAEDREFPIPIYLDYEKAEHCSYRRIIITCIEKRE